MGAAFPAALPGQRNKTFVILLRSSGLFIGQPYQLPRRTAALTTCHLWRLRVCARSQQNNGFVSFAYLTLFLLSQIVQNQCITSPPQMSTLFPSGGSPAALVFGFQLLICQRIDQRYAVAAVIQSAANFCDVAVFLHQIHGIYLPG